MRSACLCPLLACGPAVGIDADPDSESAPTETTAISSSDETLTGGNTTTIGPTDTGVGDSSTANDEDPTGFPDFAGAIPDAPPSCGRADLGAAVIGDIWIPNTQEGTVSRIDTATFTEVGRYLTSPADGGHPTGPAVSRNGDVVVPLLDGGATMIRGDLALCNDATQTSSGPEDVHDWPDGCVVWHTPMVYNSQHVAAWTAGTLDERTCRYVDAHVWTSGANDLIDVLMLDGETGVIEDTVTLVDVQSGYFGLMTGAVDSANNFWGNEFGSGELVRVDRATLAVEHWPMPNGAFALAIDRNDRVWTCSNWASRFDYPTATWTSAMIVGAGAGCTPGMGDVMWFAGNSIIGVDIETLAPTLMLPAAHPVQAISLDFEGYLWATASGVFDDEVYRVDPVTFFHETVTGLVGPDTFGSDASGTALAIVNGQL